MAQINKPKDYFNTVLYTGNGSNGHAITGVGFSPEWLWIKQRSGTRNHNLWDIVRGNTKRLISNTSGAETTETSITSFDSDGFTLDSGTTSNENSQTFVAWNWLAAGTAPSKTYTVKVVSDSGNKYRFDDFGTSAVTLEISEGGTYRFDQSDSSNSGHPLRFSTTSDGTHGGGSEYTTGVTTNGTPGSSGAYTEITVAASAPTLYYYCTNHSGMGGTANTPTTNSFSNFGGSIQSNISPNSTSLFSIVSYTGTGSAATIGHGLGVTPKMIIAKKRNGAPNWGVYHTSIGATKYLELNNNSASQTDTAVFNDTEPTSSVFSVGTDNKTNGSSGTYIAYCFAEKKGYSKFGSYTGNGSSNGPFVYTGFKPAFIMFRRTDTTGDWVMKDNKRSGTSALQNFGQMNPNQTQHPSANQTNAENKASALAMDILSNGFKPRGADTDINASSGNYIFMAFAEQPLVGTNNVPATAR
jgi:hypothetical protein